MLLLLSEVIIGIFIGIAARILIGALQTAGTLLALFASLANALIRDPIAEQQSSLISSFLCSLYSGFVLCSLFFLILTKLSFQVSSEISDIKFR